MSPNSGFPTHPHRDFEIFSYVLSGELTHRDSMLRKGAEGGAGADKFYRMRRGDVQFTTGGTGIAHSEYNEHDRDTAHFLQIWAMPWRRGLPPRYHTRHFDDDAKRVGFVPILSPLKAGVEATTAEEAAAEPTLADTIPVHADFVMARRPRRARQDVRVDRRRQGHRGRQAQGVRARRHDQGRQGPGPPRRTRRRRALRG